MKLGYLVTNDSQAVRWAPFSERYKLFEDPAKAIAFAKSIGFQDGLLGLSAAQLEPGFKRLYMAGDVSVSILALEVQS